MTNYHILAYSKNQTSIKKILKFITKKIVKLKLNPIKKITSKSIKTKKFSVLKSPHVHKKSQEQFKFTIFLIKIVLQVRQKFKLLTFLKKIDNIINSDTGLKIELMFFDKTKKNKSAFNLTLSTIKKTTEHKKDKVLKLLKFLDYYGEKNLQLKV